MFVSFIFLSSWLCVVSSQGYSLSGQEISNLTAYPVPPGTLYFMFHMNSISEIPQGYFATAPTIKTIYLQLNQLTMIEKHMFADLPDLGDLRLQQNQIHKIQAESFKQNTALIRLRLEHNLLQILSDSIFDLQNHPAALNSFYLYDNPLKCESLCWLKDANWLTVSDPNLIRCEGTGTLGGCRWNELTAKDVCKGMFSSTDIYRVIYITH